MQTLVDSYEQAINRRISEATFIGDEKLVLDFEGGGSLAIWDDGQSCCEHRYMTTDDDPSDLVGKSLYGIFVKDGPEYEEEYDVHETQFLEIATTDGTTVTFVTHNEHNGYYGGFWVKIKATGFDEQET